jgi:hypothetical protein
LKRHLKAVHAADEKRLAHLIADLDSDQFAVRASAQKELEKLGEIASPACRRALKHEPRIEVRRRLAALLEKHFAQRWHPSPKTLQALRAVEALEHIGTAEAQDLLGDVANGAHGAQLTQEAKATLQRLSKGQ